MDKCRYEIFVSSTFEDLKEERELIINEINKIGHIPIAMELFYAESKAPWDVIKEKIKSCDYYTLIISDKYGSICKEIGDKSYTHEEFILAEKLNKPMLIFVRDEQSIKSLSKEYKEQLNRQKLIEFKKLVGKYLTSHWQNKMDLITKFQNAISHAIINEPQIGWVRGTPIEVSKIKGLLQKDKPIIYIVGADSVGKSTLALNLKNRYSLDSVVGIDVLRSGIAGFMQKCNVNEEEKRLLITHSSLLTQADIDKRSELLFEPIMSMVDRLHHKKYSAIIEGVDISPSLLFKNYRVNGKFDVLLNICVSDEEEHINRYNERAKNIESCHQSSLEVFRENIRYKQEKLIKEVEIIREKKYFKTKIHKYYNIFNDGDIMNTVTEIDKILLSLNGR